MNQTPLLPNPDDPHLTAEVEVIDQDGNTVVTRAVCERGYTLFLNATEVVTLMTVGDNLRYLALGYLRNQRMLAADAFIEAVEIDHELEVIVVRTDAPSLLERRNEGITRTSGCAVGTMFGDMMELLQHASLQPAPALQQSALIALLQEINTLPSLYLAAGAIHGCALCTFSATDPQRLDVVAYIEDVGRHNAIDKLAGYIFDRGMTTANTLLYTTGRLTSEMVIKCVQLGIPYLVSRSGYTAWGAKLAVDVDLTMISRAKGKRCLIVSGAHRIAKSVAF